MNVWDGPEDRAGSSDGLFVLYYLRPSLRNLTFADEVERGRRAALWIGDTEDIDLEDDHAGALDDGEADVPLTLRQFIGMLEYYLAAEMLDEGSDEPDQG